MLKLCSHSAAEVRWRFLTTYPAQQILQQNGEMSCSWTQRSPLNLTIKLANFIIISEEKLQIYGVGSKIKANWQHQQILPGNQQRPKMRLCGWIINQMLWEQISKAEGAKWEERAKAEEAQSSQEVQQEPKNPKDKLPNLSQITRWSPLKSNAAEEQNKCEVWPIRWRDRVRGQPLNRGGEEWREMAGQKEERGNGEKMKNKGEWSNDITPTY